MLEGKTTAVVLQMERKLVPTIRAQIPVLSR